jgi:hypothetical protein
VSYVYEFPRVKKYNNFVNGFLSGWSVSGVTTIQSGAPLTLTGTNSNNAYGVTTDRVQLASGCTNSSFETGGPVTGRIGGSSGGTGYFNRVCVNGLTATGGAPAWSLLDAAGGTVFGNAGIGIINGPGQNNTDFAIVKRTNIPWMTEGANLEFRTEFFNAFNHTQFGNPGTSASTGTFGVISSTSVNPRIIQFALKLNF